VIGRYILRPEILDIIETLEPGAGGEIQLTDALAIAARDPQKYGGVVGVVFSGERYDAGDKLEYLKATIQLAVKRKELGADLLAWMKTFIADK
jgi:UTP--glucose-1-phosphate uridylyltransferase